MTSKAQLMLTPIVPDVPDSLALEEIAEAPWLFATGAKSRLSISFFPEAALRRVGEAWTEALIARAKEIREAAPEPEPTDDQ